MTATIYSLYGDGKGADGGSGPEDPMLEKRVEKLEQSMKSIETSLVEIKAELKHMPKALDFGRLEGRVSSLPTAWQMLVMVITTFLGGAGLIFTILRFGLK